MFLFCQVIAFDPASQRMQLLTSTLFLLRLLTRKDTRHTPENLDVDDRGRIWLLPGYLFSNLRGILQGLQKL